MPYFPIREIISFYVLCIETKSRHSFHCKNTGIRTTALSRTFKRFRYLYFKRIIRTDFFHRLAHFHKIIIHSLRNGDSHRRSRSSVPIDIRFCAQQTKFLSSKSHKQYSTFRFCTGKCNHTGSLHHRTNTCTAVYTTGCHIIRIKMSAYNNIFIRIFSTFNGCYDIMIFHRT